MSECSVKHLKWGATWPSREQFHELADAGYRVIPIVRRLLADSLTPVGFYERPVSYTHLTLPTKA